MSYNRAAAIMQMPSDWEPPSRQTLDSLSTSGSSDASSTHSSLQHIPAYNYFESAVLSPQHHQLYHKHPRNQSLGGGGSAGSGSGNNSSGPKKPPGPMGDHRNRMLERAAYVNRSFMHHGEYERNQLRGAGGFQFASSHYKAPEAETASEHRKQRDRRRHSVHHIAAQTGASKLDDLKYRIEELASSTTVGRGTAESGSRRPSRQNGQFVVSGSSRSQLGYGDSGDFSKGLEVYDGSRSARRQWRGTAEGRVQERTTNGTSAKTPKRGSRSSQGSTDSSHSSHSASSGSLLLTVANLENFAKIHKKHESSYGTSKAMEEYLSSTVGVVPTAAILDAVGDKYNSNIVLKHQPGADNPAHQQMPTSSAIISIEEIAADIQQQQQQLQDHNQQSSSSGLPPFPLVIKTKDPDSVSMASSTHFTMVNGVGGPQRLPKGGICSRGHQITVLIVTMSIVFMVGICAAVFFLEMRAREMPR